jgi:hypothetical protein
MQPNYLFLERNYPTILSFILHLCTITFNLKISFIMTPKIFFTVLLYAISIVSIAAQVPSYTDQTALLNTDGNQIPNAIFTLLGVVVLICIASICYAIKVFIKISKLQVISHTI